jgi:glycine hydroxymethyltransferase
LTHGARFNFSGKLYHFVHYGVDRETERIDYEVLARLADEHRPRLIVVGASAYPRWFDFPLLRQIADGVNARLMMDMAHVAGLIAADLHPDPVPYCDVITTTTHKTLRGPRGGLILTTDELGRKMDSAVFPGTQGGPLMHVIAAKAVAFGEALRPDFKPYAQRVLDNAQALTTGLEAAGLRLVSGGTDNHLVLVDLRPAGVTGDVVEQALDNAGIHTNKNMIPYDPEKPTVSSGIRLGTPAMTTRGMGPGEADQIAAWIGEIVHDVENDNLQLRIREEIRRLCERFPVPA